MKEKLITFIKNGLPYGVLNSIFDNDNSKIVSSEGEEILVCPEKMKQIKKQIKDRQRETPYSEIIINLD